MTPWAAPVLPVDSLQRRALLRGGVCIALGGAGLVAGAGTNDGPALLPPMPRPLVLAVPRVGSVSHLPLWLAHELGFFRSEGVSTVWWPVDHEAEATAAVTRGAAAMASCGFSHLLAQQARGFEGRALVVQMRTPQVVFGVSAQAFPPFKGLRDLKGRRVGSLSGGAHRLVTEHLLMNAGLQPTDLTVVPLSEPLEVLQRVRDGSLDGFCLDHTLVSVLEMEGAVRVLADTRSLQGTTDLFRGPVPGTSLLASPAWLKHTAVCQAVANGVVHALKWMRTAGPSDWLRVRPAPDLHTDRAHFLAALDKSREGLSVDGVMSADAALAAWTATAQVDRQVAAQRLRPETTYTNEFVLRAKARFRV